MGTGFRIFTGINRPDPLLVEAFRGLPVANIADEMNRFGCLDGRIKPLNAAPLLGVAFTVKAWTADNLILHKAIDMALPGDIIVVDAQADVGTALIGEIMLRQAIKRRLGGLIIDGAVRDVEALRQMNFPVYAAGFTPKGPFKNGPGEINVPVCCGGVVIEPGAILVGDADGVVAIAPRDAQVVAAAARKKSLSEQAIFQQIEQGTLDRSWVDKTLTERGCEIIDATWNSTTGGDHNG